MEANINVNIRMNRELKKQFEAFCDEVGINMTTAFTMFVKKTLREHRIPLYQALFEGSACASC